MMNKAPYIRIIKQKNKAVYIFRPTNELKTAFPNLKRMTFSNQKEADDVGCHWKAEFQKYNLNKRKSKNRAINIKKRSVNALVHEWKNSKQYGSTTESTKRNYSQIVDDALKVIPRGHNIELGKMEVKEVDFRYLDQLYQTIEEKLTRSGNSGKNKAKVTFKRLKAVWNYGLRIDLADKNVFQHFPIKGGHKRQVVWNEKQIKEMIVFCDQSGHPSMGTMILMTFQWCQRPGDVRKLKWSNFRLDIPNPDVKFTQEKTGKVMQLFVTEEINERLELHRYSFPHPPVDEDDFINKLENTGKSYTKDMLTTVFGKLRTASGLFPKVADFGKLNDDGSQAMTNIRFSDLRRTGITDTIEHGATTSQAMALSGHDTEQSFRVYAQLGTKMTGDALRIRGFLISGDEKKVID